jgi:hypothetical protein
MRILFFSKTTEWKLRCFEVLKFLQYIDTSSCDFHYKKNLKGRYRTVLSTKFTRTSSKRIFFPYHSNGDFTYYLPVAVLAPLLLFSELLLKMLSRVAMKALCQQQQGRVVVSLVRPCSSAVAAPGQRDLVNYPRR